MSDPKVAEDKRFCAKCAEPVGRSRGDRVGRDSGFCGKCGHAFDFAPKLRPGEMVGGQYEVVGCLAHGGLGWIYLARDRNVSDRWVVLKGLLDSGDADALDAALAEQRFLATVEHPSIVKIYNVVQHGGAGYTVMEFVGGKSLKNLLKDRREANGGVADPIPVEQAIAYLLELLPAFAYLHRLGLVYCDLKPDNLIQQGEHLKLIDLGGVRRLDDAESAIYGTVGFQAPEIAEMGPSVSSDLYTVARTLAVLTFDFRGYQSQFRTSLPPREEVPAFVQYDAFHRFVQKGAAAHPDDRFQTADEMAEQLLGVLRQVVARTTGEAQPAPSPHFAGPLVLGGQHTLGDWRTLPLPKIDPNDPAANALGSLTPADPIRTLQQLATVSPRTAEVEFRAVRELLLGNQPAQAIAVCDAVAAKDPWDWRADWWKGIAALQQNDWEQAFANFDRVALEVPGELAPRLAIAMTAESAGQLAQALEFYESVSVTDPSITAATLGVTRVRSRLGDRAGAVAALARIPAGSSEHALAQVELARDLLGERTSPLSEADLTTAASIVDGLRLEPKQRAETENELLQRALKLAEAKQLPAGTSVRLFGHAVDPTSLRFGIERSYRELARYAPNRRERIALVDRANQARPRTLV
jgi:serine/threonine-protein kinase PknG